MTNQEAIKILSGFLVGMDIFTDSDPDDDMLKFYEAIECAVAALSGGPLKVEITEIHQFAKPNDVSSIDFPGTGREDK